MKFILALVLLFTTNLLIAQESKVGSKVVQEIFNTSLPEELKDKQWNRWTNKNFVICSISDAQAKYLSENLDQIKEWIYTRWGLPNIDFTSECRIMAVDDKALFKKMFGIENSKIEVKTDGNKKLIAVFMLLDDKPAKSIPGPLTEVALTHFEQMYNIKFGWWLHRGMAVLNSSIADIRQTLANLNPLVKQNTPMFFSQSLLTTTEEQYNKMAPDKQALFDMNAVALTLLLRKEFGQDKFLMFMRDSSKNPEQALQTIYNFTGFNQFDVTFKRYMLDLSNDVIGATQGRITPDSYLQIKKKD